MLRCCQFLYRYDTLLSIMTRLTSGFTLLSIERARVEAVTFHAGPSQQTMYTSNTPNAQNCLSTRNLAICDFLCPCDVKQASANRIHQLDVILRAQAYEIHLR